MAGRSGEIGSRGRGVRAPDFFSALQVSSQRLQSERIEISFLPEGEIHRLSLDSSPYQVQKKLERAGGVGHGGCSSRRPSSPKRLRFYHSLSWPHEPEELARLSHLRCGDGHALLISNLRRDLR